MADIDPKCHGGRPCVKCDCMGDYGSMLREDEPDNPDQTTPSIRGIAAVIIAPVLVACVNKAPDYK